MTYQLRITFCDVEKNGFVTIGGAECETKEAWERDFEARPIADLGWDDPTKMCLDKIDLDGERVAEKPVTGATVEKLFNLPLHELIAEGRARTIFTWGQYKAVMQAKPAPTMIIQ